MKLGLVHPTPPDVRIRARAVAQKTPKELRVTCPVDSLRTAARMVSLTARGTRSQRTHTPTVRRGWQLGRPTRNRYRDTHAGRQTGEPAKLKKNVVKISISITRHNTNDSLLQSRAPPVDPHTAGITAGKVPLCLWESPRHMFPECSLNVP
eukprot:4442998-Pyramimonas_sp.AAC.1